MLAIDLPHARRLALGVVLGQAGMTVTAALCAWGIADRRAGLSALLGGGVATVGSLAMAGLAFGGGAGANAQRALGEITGAGTADDLLGRIFASFCIGK